MASRVHPVSAPNTMNLIDENFLCNNCTAEALNLNFFVNFRDPKGFTIFTQSSNGYEFNSDVENYDGSQPHSLITFNNNVRIKNKERRSTKSPQNNESDESCASYSSWDSPDKGHIQHDFSSACVLQPNLYKPITAQSNKNSKHRKRQSKLLKHTEEFDKKVHGLMRRFFSRAYKMKVEHNPESLLNGGPWDSLNQAMWDVFTIKTQKVETYFNKLDLWKSIFVFFKMCLNNYGLYLVGSTMSGFALEGSDIDICLLTRPLSNEPRMDSLHHLNYLQQALLDNDLASEAELIMAKVPILKFQSKDTGFNVDLNCNNIVGIQNTRLLYCYSQLDWRVRPLVVLVKIWAQANNINDAKKMTVSSYSWTLMVIHYLQCGVFPPILPCIQNLYPEQFGTNETRMMDVQGDIEGLQDYQSENTRCLGDLLIGFFHYYSYFNYETYAISVRTASRLPIDTCKLAKSPQNDAHQWKFLCIEEPFALSNTARSVFDFEMFKHIKQVIAASYKELACNKALNQILPVNLATHKR